MPPPSGRIPYRTLFALFLRAGLSFGGGTVVMAQLLAELVDRRRAITRSQFFTLYGLARIIPSGTTTAIAVGLGHLVGGVPASIVALLGVVLPSLVPTVALAAGYDVLRSGPWLAVLPFTLYPAAVALLAGATLSLGREIARQPLEIAIAAAALLGAILLRVNPAILLVLGGLLGALLLRPEDDPPPGAPDAPLSTDPPSAPPTFPPENAA
jgi:chromate transporter